MPCIIFFISSRSCGVMAALLIFSFLGKNEILKIGKMKIPLDVIIFHILPKCDWVSLLSFRCTCKKIHAAIRYEDVESKCVAYLKQNLGKWWVGYPPGFGWPKNKPKPAQKLHTFICKSPKHLHGFFVQVSSFYSLTLS